jgi:hypothetical protein
MDAECEANNDGKKLSTRARTGADGIVRYQIRIPPGVACAIQLDVKECCDAAGLTEDVDIKHNRRDDGAVAWLTPAQILKLASASERCPGWDMSPQAIAGCNRFVRRLLDLAQEAKKRAAS